MMSSVSSAFDKLPPRPPTPPREISKAINDAIAFLDDSNEVDRLLNNDPKLRQSLADTAVTGSSQSSQDPANGGTGLKKVGFSLEPVDIDSEVSVQDSSPTAQSTRRPFAVKKNAKPVRSILKLTYPSLPPTPESLKSKLEQFSPDIPGSFAKMLQSVIQQLSGSSRTSRLDAYLAINGVLRTYAGVPDVQAMAQRMDLFMQFLARDMCWKDPEGNFDVNIITQALKLTSTILATASLAEVLDTDFKVCLVERSITVFEHPNMPKAIVKATLIVAAQQRFHSYMLSQGRADRLLTALKTIEERCSGNGVIAARLIIYLRMIEQSPSVMLPKIADWIEHVFHGMLSSIKDIRNRAIDTCMEAGLAFGQQPAAAKALHLMLVTEVEDGQTYFDFLLVRLIELISDHEVGQSVPQIWSAVILFFRSKRMPPANWPKMKSWLNIIQKCLNSSDMEIKHQATVAWNMLVFAAMPDASTDRNFVSMLKVPIVRGLTKRGGDKHAQQLRQDALDSYCNLLHYSLRPGLSKEDLDAAWDVHVNPVLSELVKTGGKGRHIACRILQGVFKGDTGIWDSKAALEPHGLAPERLPKLDPRWVRSRLDKILTGIEPMLATELQFTADANGASNAAWSALMQSIADAGNQEVKTSQELKRAIALLINVFRRLWTCPKDAQPGVVGSRWLERYVSLIRIMVENLGAGPFAEDILAATKDHNIEVAPTPSQRHSKQAAQPQSPMTILLQQFLAPPDELPVDDGYMCALGTLLKLLTSSKPTTAGGLALLDSCLRLLSPVTDTEPGNDTRTLLWTSISRAAVIILSSPSQTSNAEEPQNTGQALRHAFTVLAAGLAFTIDEAAYIDVEKLYDSIHDKAIVFAGDGGNVLAVVEPFSKALSDTENPIALDFKLRLACRILEQVAWPKSRQSLDLARKSLWGVNLAHPAHHKSAIFDPFEHLYVLTNDLAACAYRALGTDEACDIYNTQSFIVAVCDLLNRSPLPLLGVALRKLQPALTIWVRDESRNTGADGEASKLVRDTWTHLIRLLKKIPSKGNDFLKVTMEVIIAGMSSPHKAIVNDCIVFWNNTFGQEESLDYPPALETVLRARSIDAEIILPTFPEDNTDSDIVNLPAFFETQIDLSPKATFAYKKTNVTNQRSPLQKRYNSFSPARRTIHKSASVTPKPRLRHDNSQIQFAPIEPSPLPTANDSQLLTEHQKEVKNRQHENAHIFQDFSSSPSAQSTALRRGVSKRLDFKSNVQEQEVHDVQVTPSGMIDGSGLMSDDLPSSPTPSSGRDTRQDALEEDDDDAVEDDANEGPPSSPPQTSRASAFNSADDNVERNFMGSDDTTVDVIDVAIDGNRVASDHVDAHQDGFGNSLKQPIELGSDLPSDSILPTAQLRQEEEEASARQSLSNSINADQAEATMSERGQPGDDEGAAQIQSDDGVNDEDLTRIKNSFNEPPENAVEEDTQLGDGTQQSRRTGKKRKRTATTMWTSKKRKQQSPFKRLATYLLGQSQEEENDDDEDIGDEIVVASSQQSSSPVSQVALETPVEPMASSNEQSVSEVKIEHTADVPMPPVKRGRGRPRKSEKPTTSQVATVNQLKRKASALDDASVSEEHDKSQTVLGATTLIEEPQADTQSRRVTRKTATAVVVGNDEPPVVNVSSANALSLEDKVPDRVGPFDAQERDEVAPTRPIVTARSILSRLHETLADIGGIILGSQEEREFDDILFAIRTGVHDAGRRGRESTGRAM